jgi:hypothetical protein
MLLTEPTSVTWQIFDFFSSSDIQEPPGETNTVHCAVFFRYILLKSRAVFCGMQARHDCIEAGPVAGQSIIYPLPRSSAGQSLLSFLGGQSLYSK